ncbi:hypothetical protein NECAME_12485 [Necator americanus]|uniref:Endonuclease/exonuclease/phosphatase domain-containing protein n=1 Tax=Necator americanus TaxID=51031 RepID=W2SZZ5_NECAM|nr:hypothetical protein NECAME_12485 [Necator americanus]ETN75315.1 hypothetical protein NECAME_12485 [Necator americanus]
MAAVAPVQKKCYKFSRPKHDDRLSDSDDEEPKKIRSYIKPRFSPESGIGGVGIPVNTSMTKNTDSFEKLTMRMRKCGPTPALAIFVAYAPTSSYEDQEFEAFYMDLEELYREDHTFYKVIISDFNAKIGSRGTSHRDPRPTLERIGGEAF